MAERINRIFREYPQQFWLLMGAVFIDRLGHTLLFPFFALYITHKFDVGLKQVGVIFAIFSIMRMIGSFLGGALSDKFGRKGVMIFGLVTSALTNVLFGVANDLSLFYAIAVLNGFFTTIGSPAMQSMIADILPEHQRAEGYSMFRVNLNVTWVLGPILGGLIATRSYLALFVIDAITSIIMAYLVWVLLYESKPQPTASDAKTESMATTFRGYHKAIADLPFMLFIVVSMLLQLVYQQMYSTLPIYLRDYHDLPNHYYGYLMSTSGIMVVLFQFWITRKLRSRPPFLAIAFGSVFYLIGFGMYGFVSAFAFFVLGVMLITIGEMIIFPTGNALVAQFAPEAMRGRYMAVYEFSFAIPATIGVWLAGVIMDEMGGEWIWYLCGIGSAISGVAYLYLHRFHSESQMAAGPDLAHPVAEVV